ncbi:MAG: tRNA (guanosine(46)-N7)-methyltransferase TrmB [Hyphomicrobium sp.]
MQEQLRNFKSEGIRSFGRIRARKRSARQERLLREVLPKYLLSQKLSQTGFIEPNFEKTFKELWLEIGFGGAEHLLQLAKRYPDIGIIGSEPFEGGIIKALSALENDNKRNILLFNADVRPLLRVIQRASFNRIFILFPDPWPKARHAKRRLINNDFIEVLVHIMKPGGHLHIATDIRSYAREIFDLCSHHGGFLPQTWDEVKFAQPWADWSGTRYESKALKQGRFPLFLTFLRENN